jgi:hypothetical protein
VDLVRPLPPPLKVEGGGRDSWWPAVVLVVTFVVFVIVVPIISAVLG